ncbi:MAG: hypothetical protein ACJ71K_16955, partial [Nitrososphaeraceae archaeon]
MPIFSKSIFEIHPTSNSFELWQIDFINGVAEKINNLETYIMHKPSSDKYPYRLSSQGINTIEDFLLLTYTQNGLN